MPEGGAGCEEEVKDSPSPEEEEEWDSESSYYSTAEEDITETLEEDIEGVSLQDDSPNVSPTYHAQTRYRAPSKKQKRKRRCRTTYCDQTLPFMTGGFDIEDDIQQVVAEIQGKQFSVLREVPSLAMMCIKLLRGIRFPADSMPHLVKSHIYGANADLKFKKFQYGWLFNLLAFVNKEKIGLEIGKKIYRLPMCSVWYPLPYLHKSSRQFTDHYNKNKITPCLMYTSGHTVEGIDHYILNLFRIIWILSVLGHIMDCMLPSQIAMGKYKKDKSEEDQIKTATNKAVQWTKTVLSRRLPDSADRFFNLSLPYVFWARGDISHATELFCQLSQSEKRCRHKAVYLNEAGRMHAISGETITAAKFYRLAAEAALSKGKNQQYTSEMEGQAMMLLASLNDQGIMAHKARSSWAGWKAVFSSNTLESEGAALHAVESWLCFHAGSWQGDCWEESVSRIFPLCAKHSMLLYHLSLVHALRGDAQNSLRSYNDFRSKEFGSNLPGEEIVNRRSQNPWLPLVQAIEQQGQITCIPILWRTLLRPLCLQTKPRVTEEADLISEQLNLRLTAQGLLTGDMQLLLPPSGGIYLDPYTGKLTYNDNRTEPWRAVTKDSWKLLLPTPLEVYHDEEGVRVELLMTSQDTLLMNKVCGFPYPLMSPLQDICTLVWYGPSGKTVKTSLLPKFNDLIYKNAEGAINISEFKIEKDRQSVLQRLHALYRKGCVLNFQDIKDDVSSWNRYDERNKNKKRRRRPLYGQKQSYTLCAKPFMFGKAVAMIFDQSLPNYHSKLLVIANCSTAESFQKMKVYYIENWSLDLAHFKTPIRTSQFHHGYRIKDAEIIHFTFLNKPEPNIKVFDQDGSIVDTIPIKHNDDDSDDGVHLKEAVQGQIYPLIVRDEVIAITQTGRLWCRRNGDNFIHIDVKEAVSVAAFGDVLIVLMENKTQFLSAHQLQVLDIRVTDSCQRSLNLKIGESMKTIEQGFKTVQVLATQTVSRPTGPRLMCIAALDRTIVCLEAPTELSKCTEVTVTLTISLAGYPVEAYIINQRAGFLLTFTQHSTLSEAYIEHLCHYKFDGQLQGVIPCLGPGPRSFHHAYLPGDSNEGGAGLYLYMRDGHNGIVGIKIEDHPH